MQTGSLRHDANPTGKALNRPQLILGIDKRLIGMAFIGVALIGQNDGWQFKAAAIALFLAVGLAGRLVSRKDPKFFLVMNKYRQQKSLYDPLKREPFRLRVEKRNR